MRVIGSIEMRVVTMPPWDGCTPARPREPLHVRHSAINRRTAKHFTATRTSDPSETYPSVSRFRKRRKVARTTGPVETPPWWGRSETTVASTRAWPCEQSAAASRGRPATARATAGTRISAVSTRKRTLILSNRAPPAELMPPRQVGERTARKAKATQDRTRAQLPRTSSSSGPREVQARDEQDERHEPNTGDAGRQQIEGVGGRASARAGGSCPRQAEAGRRARTGA